MDARTAREMYEEEIVSPPLCRCRCPSSLLLDCGSLWCGLLQFWIDLQLYASLGLMALCVALPLVVTNWRSIRARYHRMMGIKSAGLCFRSSACAVIHGP